MHFVTDPSEADFYVAHFYNAISKDPYSWQEWRLLAIESQAGQWQQSKLCKASILAKSLLRSADGAIIQLENVALIIFNGLEGFDYAAFKQAIEKHMPLDIEDLTFRILPVWDSYNEILAYLKKLLSHISNLTMLRPASSEELKPLVPNIDDLLDVWTANCRNRFVRAAPQIMLVEDDAVTRHIVNQALKTNYAIVAAHDAADAVRQYLVHTPDIIFLDIGLPDYDGLSLLNWMRQQDPLCKVIMFSSNGYLQNRLLAFAAGAHGFVTKPFSKTNFEHYIAGWRPAAVVEKDNEGNAWRH